MNRKMNSNLSKKLLAVAMTSLFLISMGASAYGETKDTKAKCEQRGGKWEPTPKPAHCSVKP